MTDQAWIALAALILTIFLSAISTVAFLYRNKNEILKQMASDKESIDSELMIIRLSAFEEYKTLRQEIGDTASIARKEFGETIIAIREKITQVELWTRDQFTDTKHTLNGTLERHHKVTLEKIEKSEDRVRQLELFSASKGYTPEN